MQTSRDVTLKSDHSVMTSCTIALPHQYHHHYNFIHANHSHISTSYLNWDSLLIWRLRRKIFLTKLVSRNLLTTTADKYFYPTKKILYYWWIIVLIKKSLFSTSDYCFTRYAFSCIQYFMREKSSPIIVIYRCIFRNPNVWCSFY